MKLVPVFGDFESFWSPTHSLTKMSPIVYATHKDTELISLSLKVGSAPAYVVFGEPAIKEHLKSIDWSDKFLIAHNMSGFDSMLFAWRCGVRPAMWGCTLAMARPLHGLDVGGSLAKLVEHYKLGVKDNKVLLQTKGRHFKDFTSEEVCLMEKYNSEDTEQCAALFQKLLPHTSQDELKLIDMTIRELIFPKFQVDVPLLENALAEEQERKASLLYTLQQQLGVDTPEEVRSMLASAPKFAARLTAWGVPVPMKPSPADPNKQIPALAKSDEEFLALQEHPNPLVAAAASARLDVKSTILETRIEAFLEVARATGGRMPIAKNYYGAHTGRWSGSMSLNQENLPRILPGKPKPSDVLRKSLIAGPGKKVVVADYSGIELRVNMFLWKVQYAMDLFIADPEKADLYKTLASEVLGVPIEGMLKMQRQAGKAMHLGCGFGLGNPEKYIAVAKQMAQIDVSLEDALDHIAGYRKKHPEIVKGWRTCHGALAAIAAGAEYQIDPWGLCHTSKEGIHTPKGMIRYPGLHQETADGKQEWWYGTGRNRQRIYAGKVTENCLAAGTLVLTDSGWRPIEAVQLTDKVHDGDAFVPHAGSILKSVQDCVNVDGVYMTTDHEVLDEDGTWKEASQLPRPYRPAVRSADRLEPIAQQRKTMALGVSVRMWGTRDEVGAGHNQGGEEGRNPQLRVPNQTTHKRGQLYARHDQASSVWRLAEHVRQMSATFAQSMEKLRGAWNYGMRPLARVLREFLGRYGPLVPARVGPGPYQQRGAIFAGELPVGFSEGKHAQPPQYKTYGRSHLGVSVWNIPIDAVLPATARARPASSSGRTQSHEVYDILDAGPKHRFIVLGENGPFIVHNCVQHLARQKLCDDLITIKKETGVYVTHTVHDEPIYVVPEAVAEKHLATVHEILRTPPTWWSELVTWSEGDIADTYGDAK